MDLSLYLYVVLSCVGRGPCSDLISRPKESYHVSHRIRAEVSKLRGELLV
jgi:hypothetical protein